MGERSEFEIEEVQLQEVGIGIVSKDLSEVVVTRIVLRDIDLAAFMAYHKKPEYGPGSLLATVVDFDDSAKLGVVQYGSLLRVEGVEMAGSDVDVDSLYASGRMRK